MENLVKIHPKLKPLRTLITLKDEKEEGKS